MTTLRAERWIVAAARGRCAEVSGRVRRTRRTRLNGTRGRMVAAESVSASRPERRWEARDGCDSCRDHIRRPRTSRTDGRSCPGGSQSRRPPPGWGRFSLRRTAGSWRRATASSQMSTRPVMRRRTSSGSLERSTQPPDHEHRLHQHGAVRDVRRRDLWVRHRPRSVRTLGGRPGRDGRGEESMPPLHLPCREVFARGGRAIVVDGPVDLASATEVHQGFWT